MRGDFWDRGCCQSRTHSLSLFSVLIINLRPNQVSFGMMGRQRDMFFARNILLGIGLQLLLQGPICRHTHTHTHNDTYTLAEVGLEAIVCLSFFPPEFFPMKKGIDRITAQGGIYVSMFLSPTTNI